MAEAKRIKVRDLDEKTGYVTTLVNDTTARVQKVVEGHVKATYTVSMGNCSCPASKFRAPGQCKHVDIVERARNRKGTAWPFEDAMKIAEEFSKNVGDHFLEIKYLNSEKNEAGEVTVLHLEAKGPLEGTMKGFKYDLEIHVHCVKGGNVE